MAGQETPAQRINRELIELLNEIRVVLPGVQVLLAFLLAVPFQQRFTKVTPFQRGTYFTTVVLTLVATALLIAPSSYHRLNFRRRRKDRILQVANWLVIVGTAFLALSLTGVVVLIADVVYGATASLILGLGALLLMGGAWFVFPLTDRRRMGEEERRAGDDPMLIKHEP